MHQQFGNFLKPIRNKSLSIGEPSFYASRELSLTNQGNEFFEKHRRRRRCQGCRRVFARS